MLFLKIAGWVSNSVDPVEMPLSVASHLGLHCLLKPVCLYTYGKYGISCFFFLSSTNSSVCFLPFSGTTQNNPQGLSVIREELEPNQVYLPQYLG